MYFDFHLHSHYSKDSILSPSKIIKKSLNNGLSGVAVTDHNTIKGAIKTRDMSPDNFFVIVGSEIMTEKCELIGIFLNEEIPPGNFFDVMDKIRDQDGISILPHPYKGNAVDPISVINYIDLVEGLNARIDCHLNEKAKSLAKVYNKRIVAGTDSHTPFEIGNVKNKITLDSLDEESIRKKIKCGDICIVGNEAPFYIQTLSKGVGRFKKSGIKGLSTSLCKKIKSW